MDNDHLEQNFKAGLATFQGQPEKYAEYGVLLQRALALLGDRVRQEEARLESVKAEFRQKLGLVGGDISQNAYKALFEPFYRQVEDAQEQQKQVARFVEIWKEFKP